VKLHETPDDRQSEAKAAESAGSRRVGLLKAIKHVREEVRTNAGTVVLHNDFRLRPGAPHDDTHAPTLGRELECVGEQIPDHLLQPRRIASHRSDRGVQLALNPDAFLIGGVLNGLNGRVDHGCEMDALHIEVEFPRDDPADVEQV
jgi:hypothetical protein